MTLSSRRKEVCGSPLFGHFPARAQADSFSEHGNDRADGATVSEVATVTGVNETDTATGNDSATANTTVNTVADRSISKSGAPGPVIAGNRLNYTVTVNNNVGPSDAQNVVVTDTLPPGVTFVSTTGCAEDPNGVPTCTLGAIVAGGSAQYTVIVDVESGTSGTIINNARFTSDTTLVNLGDDFTSEPTTVLTPSKPVKISSTRSKIWSRMAHSTMARVKGHPERSNRP